MARGVAIASACALLSQFVAGCGPAPATKGGENLLLITLCGARADVVDEAIASGAVPALAALRQRAAGTGGVATVESTAAECSRAHGELLTVVPSTSLGFDAFGWAGLDEACAKDGYATAAFLSRSELFSSRGQFATFDLPPIEAVSMEMFGPKAAALELRRAPAATADAALDWLGHATTPFFAWIELDALAIEQADAPEPLREVAKRRLVAIDAAVARIVDELARGGRDRRTWIVLVSEHGEALGEQVGEEATYGHRRLLPCVTQVPLWIVAPREGADASAGEVRSLSDVGWRLARTLGLSTKRDPASEEWFAKDAAWIDKERRKDSDTAPPLSFLAEQARVPLTDAAARAVLPKLRELLPPASGQEQLRLAELYLGALHALAAPTDAEKAEQSAARKQWLETVADSGFNERPLAATLYARPDPRNDAPLDRRLQRARDACNVWPWYFPAVRTFASLEQMALHPAEAIAALEKFGKEAPLTPAARTEFEKLLAATRRNVAPQLPDTRPPR